MPKFAPIASIALAAATLTGPLASPVQAQPAATVEDYRPRVDVLIENLNQLSGAIATARKNKAITPAEASGLRSEVHATRQAISTHGRDGITATEFRELAQRVNAIRAKLKMDRMDF